MTSNDNEFDYTGGYDPDEANGLSGFDRAVYILSHKANAAINSGRLSEEDATAKLQQKVDGLKKVYEQYGDSAFDKITAPASIKYTKPDFSDAKSDMKVEDRPSTGVLDNLQSGFYRGMDRAAQGILMAGAGAQKLMNPGLPDEALGDTFSAIDYLGKREDTLHKPTTAGEKIAQGVGGFIPGILTAGAGEAGAAGADVIRQGGTLGQAETALGIEGAANLAGLGAAKLTNNLGLASRLLLQSGAGGVTEEASRLARNEALPENMRQDFDPVAFGMSAGGAATGAFFPERPHTTNLKPDSSGFLKEVPKTGDPDIDAGIKAGTDFSKPAEQQDLFSPQNELGLDMFSKESVPANVIESRRQQAELANLGEAPVRSQEQQAQLEQDYLFQQQDRLDQARQAQNNASDIVSSRGGIPEQYLGIANTEMPTGDTNTAMYRAMMTGLAERGQLRNEPVPTRAQVPGERQIFEPSQVPTVDQTIPQQGELSLPRAGMEGTQPLQGVQGDLFGQPAAPKPQTPITEPTTPRQARGKMSDQELRQAILDKLNGPSKAAPEVDVDQATRPNVPFDKTVPDSVRNVPNGELNTDHILDAISNNHENRFTDEQVDYANQVGNFAKATGQQPAGIVRDAGLWNQMVKDNPNLKPNTIAVFEPNINEGRGGILINPEAKSLPMKTLMHETSHAYKYRAVEMGANRQLPGPSQRAYDFLNNLADTFRPELIKAAEARRTAMGGENYQPARGMFQRETYGLQTRRDLPGGETTNIHELLAEMDSNSHFRDSLKEMPLDNIKAAQMGMGRLYLGKIRNMYEAIRNGFNRLIGVSPKADTAYDALAASHSNFLNEVQDSGINVTGQRRARAVADTGAGEERIPERPIGTLESTLRWLTGTPTESRRTLDDIATDTRGAENAARVRAQQWVSDTKNAMAKDGAPIDALDKYINGDDTTALNKFPQTKQMADQFMNQRSFSSRELAKHIISNNPTRADMNFALKILDNDFYMKTSYLPDSHGQNLVKTARAVDEKLANDKNYQASTAEQQAKTKVDAFKTYVKDNVLPHTIALDERGVPQVSLNEIKNRARYLGLDPAAITRRVGGDRESKITAIYNEMKRIVPTDEAVNTAVDRLIDDAVGLGAKANSPIARYRRGAKFGDVMTNKEQVPPALRDLWGETHDTFTNATSTMVKQAMGLAHFNQQANIRDAGLGKWLFPDKVSAPDGYTAKLSGKKYGSLQGMWTTPQIEAMLKGHVELNTAANDWATAINSPSPATAGGTYLGTKAVKTYMRGVQGYKVLRMLGDPFFHVQNIMGAPQISFTNGRLNILDGMRRGGLAQLAELSPAFVRALPEGMRVQVLKDRDYVIKSGFNERSATAEFFNESEARKLAESLSQGGSDTSQMRRAMQTVRKYTMDAGEHALALTDGWARRDALLNRMDVLEKMYNDTGQAPSKSDPKAYDDFMEKVRAEAAADTRNTTLHSTRAAGIAQALEKSGGSIGILYQAESIRNMVNGYVQGWKDIQRGLSLADQNGGKPYTPMMMHGFKQIMGTTGAMTMWTKALMAVGSAGMAMMGLDTTDVDRNDKRKPFLDQPGGRTAGMPLQEIMANDPNFKYYWSPADTHDFYYGWNHPLHVGMDAIADAMEGKQIDMKRTMDNMFSTYVDAVGRNPGVIRLLNVLRAKPPSWYQHAPDSTAYETERADLKNMGLSQENADRVIALKDMFIPGILRNQEKADVSKGNEAGKSLLRMGLGVVQVPNDAGLSSGTGKAVEKKFNEGMKPLLQDISDPAVIKDSVITDKYVDALKKTAEQMKLVKEDFQYAQAAGIDPRKAAAMAMLKTGLKEDMLGLVLNGRMNPALLVTANVESAADKAAKEAADDPDKLQQISENFRNKAKLLRDLTNKYRNYTVDQVGAL